MNLIYNFLSTGTAYNDIRNVCSSLSKKLREIFKEEYGKINYKEEIIDKGISILIDLIIAYNRKEFPKCAENSLEKISNGVLEKYIKKILELN